MRHMFVFFWEFYSNFTIMFPDIKFFRGAQETGNRDDRIGWVLSPGLDWVFFNNVNVYC